MGSWSTGRHSYADIVSKAVAAAMAATRTTEPEKGWKCKRSDCLYAVRGWPNWPGRTHCQGCFQTKHAATHPPDHARLEHNQARLEHSRPGAQSGKELTNKEQKKREARARRRAQRQERKANEAAAEPPKNQPRERPTATATTVQEEPVTAATAPTAQPLTLPKEVTDAIPMLLPGAAKEIVGSLSQEFIPPATEDKAPEATLAKFVGAKGPTAKAAKKEELIATISRLKDALVPLEQGGEPLAAMADSLKAKIEENEVALSKLAKDAPTQNVEHKSVAEAKAHFEVEIQRRKDREAKGAAAAQERAAHRELLIKKLKEQVNALEEGMNELVKTNTERHVARAQAAAAHDSKVLKLFDAKLKSLPTTPAQARTPLKSLAEVEDAEQRMAELLEETQQLQAQLSSARGAVQQEFERSFDDITARQVPIADMPEKDELTAYGTLYEALQSWMGAGAATPFDWESLRLQSATKPGPNAPTIIKLLLGDLWKKWYAEDPTPTMVVPRQVVTIAYSALNHIKLEYESKETQDEVMKAAGVTIALLTESGKRLRAA